MKIINIRITTVYGLFYEQVKRNVERILIKVFRAYLGVLSTWWINPSFVQSCVKMRTSQPYRPVSS